MAIAGPNIGLPFPTSPYPTPYVGGPSAAVWSNQMYFLAGQKWLVPPGWWIISTASTTQTNLQALDPITAQWFPVLAPASGMRSWFINSDGSNYRVANLMSSLTGAAVTAAGSGYVQASTTVTAGTGVSTWAPVVGGSITSVTIGADKNGTTGGTNFTYAPLLVVQAPPAGGVQATASCTISAGAINAITVRAGGAGYTSVPGVLIIPMPDDPSLGSITLPALTAVVGGAGTLTAVLLVNPGAPVTSAPTLTVNGVGSSATCTATLFSASTTADTVFVQWLGGGG
jgi:hypothetical protein